MWTGSDPVGRTVRRNGPGGTADALIGAAPAAEVQRGGRVSMRPHLRPQVWPKPPGHREQHERAQHAVCSFQRSESQTAVER